MSQPWIITSSELKECIQNVTLVDVREPDEFAVSHIKGCKHIPIKELQQRAESELSKSDKIVVYCAHGVRSVHGVMVLLRMGFDQPRSLEGGIVAWEEMNGASRNSS